MSKLIKIFLITLLALAISCKNEDKTGGGGDVVQGYTHSNHPPEGEYMQVYPSGMTNTNTIATVTHINGNCNITGKVYPDSGSGIEYDITVTSWYAYPDPNSYLNRAGNWLRVSGEATITKPASSTLNFFDVEYYTTNQSIIVSLRTTQDSKYYKASDLKRYQ